MISFPAFTCKPYRDRVLPGEPKTWSEPAMPAGLSGRYLSAVRGGSDGNWVSGCNLNIITNDTTKPTDTWTRYGTSIAIRNKTLDYDGTYWCASDYVASAKLYTATNPTLTWTARTGPSGKHVTALKYANNIWVAGTNDGYIYTATNPTSTWTSRGQAGFGNQINDISYGNGYWVAVGKYASVIPITKFIYTDDPTSSWIQLDKADIPIAVDLGGVDYGNGYWAASHATGIITCKGAPSGNWSTQGQAMSAPHTIAYGGGAWVCGGGNGVLYTCGADPSAATAWTCRVLPSGGSNYIKDVKYYNGYWVAVGYNSAPTGYMATAKGGV